MESLFEIELVSVFETSFLLLTVMWAMFINDFVTVNAKRVYVILLQLYFGGLEKRRKFGALCLRLKPGGSSETSPKTVLLASCSRWVDFCEGSL
jgi:hypothetical protein